jgi:hypothetical protein
MQARTRSSFWSIWNKTSEDTLVDKNSVSYWVNALFVLSVVPAGIGTIGILAVAVTPLPGLYCEFFSEIPVNCIASLIEGFGNTVMYTAPVAIGSYLIKNSIDKERPKPADDEVTEDEDDLSVKAKM